MTEHGRWAGSLTRGWYLLLRTHPLMRLASSNASTVSMHMGYSLPAFKRVLFRHLSAQQMSLPTLRGAADACMGHRVAVFTWAWVDTDVVHTLGDVRLWVSNLSTRMGL